jgi:uncharacterized protein
MSNSRVPYVVFHGDRRLAAGEVETVITAALDAPNREQGPLYFFRTDTGRQVQFDLTGTREEVLARVAPPAPRSGPGRPRIGTVCGEICLLPRHWEWLERQPRRASATLRLLVEQAMKNMTPEERARELIDAAHGVMWALAGDRVGFEEASRALYNQKWEIFDRLIAPWPEDIVAQLREMVAPARSIGAAGAGAGAGES